MRLRTKIKAGSIRTGFLFCNTSQLFCHLLNEDGAHSALYDFS